MQKSITLNPGASGTVVFYVTPTAPDTYVISLDGLGGSFQAVSGAKFILTDLVVSPSVVDVGQTVSVSVKVTNVGDKAGTKVVSCDITPSTYTPLELLPTELVPTMEIPWGDLLNVVVLAMVVGMVRNMFRGGSR